MLVEGDGQQPITKNEMKATETLENANSHDTVLAVTTPAMADAVDAVQETLEAQCVAFYSQQSVAEVVASQHPCARLPI